MKMFVLKNVDLIEVTNNPLYIDHYVTPELLPYLMKPRDTYSIITREEITGRRFVNNRNEIICFGMSKQAEKTLGVSLDAIDALSKQIDQKNEIIDTLQAKLYKFKNMTTLDKIFAIFKKNIYM